MLLVCLPLATMADSRVNLTPVPMKMTVGDGKLTLPESFIISTGDLNADAATEAIKFSKLFNEVTGYSVNVAKTGDALITMQMYTGNEAIGDEGYTLDITADGIAIAANDAKGFYYAFQSIKKMLPANVMAEVKDSKVTEYSLPCVNIVDAPRFEYRGFMLDVSRHYFGLDQIKRMIDVMAYYKMNRFHWHLTDDQGWRFEVKKYPRLTTVGATRDNSWSTDPEYGKYYTNEPYGPYFYTQDECREIVAYAAERHIEVVPEIEFPGHSCAVNAAYPELSCYPDGSHNVQVEGGVFSDVLNVASPLVLQFAKDVLDEVIEVFPHEQIHIGGDETPTSAWQNNAECQAFMTEKGFTNVRQLQSYFVRQISDHVTQKEGDKRRTVIMWNESLTSNGTDEELIIGTGGTMMCWEISQAQPCALKAAQNGMKSIITTQVPYYINRRQSTDSDEPKVAGSGSDNVQTVYNYMPVPASVPTELQKYYVGVQGTFWTEHVEDYGLLEYLALPRLIAMAETGWTPQSKKNFADFQERITKDAKLLDYNNYKYGRHYMLDSEEESGMVMPTPSTEENMTWYRIVTNATDNARAGRCIQLLREGMNIADKTGTAPANRLWNSEIIEDENNAGYDYQLWAFMQDPGNPERWAIVSKAKPNGSVKGTPTAENNTGRWDYDDNNRHYDFIIGDKVYEQKGNNYNYSIRSQKVSNTSMCLNYAGNGQNYSINMWNDPRDGNGGVWEFRPLVATDEPVVSEYPTAGKHYRIVNNTERFKGWSLYDNGNDVVTAGKQTYGADLWEVAEASTTNTGQTFKLRNVATGRYISGTTAPVTLGDNGAVLTNVYNEKSGDFSIKAGNAALYPLSEHAANNPNTLSTGGVYPQGAGWVFEEAYLVTYNCYDEEGNLMERRYQTAVTSEPFTPVIPEIANYSVISQNNAGSAINITYKRTSFNIAYKCFSMDGNLITTVNVPCEIGSAHAASYPEVEFYTFVWGDLEEGETFTPQEDCEICANYDTEGVMGVAGIGEAVTELEGGVSYLIYNAKNESSRSGFLSTGKAGDRITTTNTLDNAGPAFIWNFEGDGNRFTVKNNNDAYIPRLIRGTPMTSGDTPETFVFTYSESAGTWTVQGTSNSYYWNGNSDHTFTGWDDAHPFIIYSYKPHPYFTVSYRCVNLQGEELASGTRYVKGGEQFNMLTPIFDGYTSVECNVTYEELARVTKNIEITYTYLMPGETTAIDEVKTENGNAKGIYDLSGRKVTTPTKGIYIKDGKKILIK